MESSRPRSGTTERHETVIVGGGHAGLAMSHALSRRGRAHVVLERGRLAERWRSERWDSLRFQFPNWSLALPGQPYDGGDPEGFATRDDVVAFIERYAAAIAAPVRTGVDVSALGTGRDGFRLETSHGALEAESVVVATGPYQEPVIPARAPRCPADGAGALERLPEPGSPAAGRGAGGGLGRLRLPDRRGPARGGPPRAARGRPPSPLPPPLSRP